VRNSPTGVCDVCKHATYMRLCPICHNPIPEGAEKRGSNIFVVLGSKGVGKSNYLSVLINTLTTTFSSEFGVQVIPASDRTAAKYRGMYYDRLFKDGRILEPTSAYDVSGANKDPMIFYLKPTAEDERKMCTLALFDTSGKDLDTPNNLMSLNIGSFVAAAAGIVFLVDPLQIPYVNERIHIDGKPEPTQDVCERLRIVADLIRSRNKIKPSDRIDIPLAVVLTKADVLMKSPEDEKEEDVLLGPESSIHIPREPGAYDAVNTDEISSEIEEYLRRTIPDGFTDVIGEFAQHKYFAVSSLGRSPVGDSLPRGISPFRVEDPFIWLLYGTAADRRKRQ